MLFLFCPVQDNVSTGMYIMFRVTQYHSVILIQLGFFELLQLLVNTNKSFTVRE